MIGFIASDLIWSSRIKATADAVGLKSKRLFNPDGLAALIAAGPVELVLVDLESEDRDALIGALRGPDATPEARSIPTLAWGPHVLVEQIQAARDAGIDAVVTRGAFSNRLESILERVAAGERFQDSQSRDCP